MSGPPLGRPPKEVSAADKKQARDDEAIRQQIEGKFGQAKRRFGLGRIMTKLTSTSAADIFVAFFTGPWLVAGSALAAEGACSRPIPPAKPPSIPGLGARLLVARPDIVYQQALINSNNPNCDRNYQIGPIPETQIPKKTKPKKPVPAARRYRAGRLRYGGLARNQ